jgi:uncharacterized phage-like protein YoqJ
MNIVAFTGARPNKLGGYKIPNPTFNFVCKETEKLLLKIKPNKCYSGMALGYDTWCSKICLKLDIPFVAAVPFKGQEVVWNEESKKEYNELLDLAEEVVFVSSPGYSAWKMMKRNKFMVDNSDIVIACFDGNNGGTKNCFEYAKLKGKKIFLINSLERKIHEYL